MMRLALVFGVLLSSFFVLHGAAAMETGGGYHPPYRTAYDYNAYFRHLAQDEATTDQTECPTPAPPEAPEAPEMEVWSRSPYGATAPIVAPPFLAVDQGVAGACGAGDPCRSGRCVKSAPSGRRCASGGLLSDMGGVSALENISLSHLAGLECSCLDFGGWTQLGYHSNNTQLSAAYNDGLAFNDVPDHLHLQQQWFYLGREADGNNGFDVGFRTDFVYGTDAQKTQAFGNSPGSWDEDWDHGEYGWAIPQWYGEMAMGDLSVKVGHFFTPVGYEVIPATGNFFYSHSYTMFNSEPFTHTGVLTTYRGFERLTLYGGWTLGWDTGFDNVNQGNSWLGGFSADLSDDVKLTYINTYGNFGSIDGVTGLNADDSYSHSVVMNVALTNDLQYVIQSDYVRIDNPTAAAAAVLDPVQRSLIRDDLGINQYLLFRYNDVLSLGQRIEWWKRDGISHYESTSGVNVRLLSNLIMRPEYRIDWSPAQNVDQRTFGVDTILTY